MRHLRVVRRLPDLGCEWDPAKHAKNLRTRGIGFDAAALLFEGELNAWPDIRAAFDEVWINAIGDAEGKILRVTCTMHGRGGADHPRLARKPERQKRVCNGMLTQMTAREIKAQLARRPPHAVVTARARYGATTEAEIRRHMRGDGFDPDADRA